MAGDCGCRKCRSPLPDKKRQCKPFSICVGNHSLIWDGDCATIVDRDYKIPDGTYTSITFSNGCIVGVGQAPIPIYTPQACCDGTEGGGGEGGTDITPAPSANNLAVINGNMLSVEPIFGVTETATVSGNGKPGKEWKVNVKVSDQIGNRLQSTVNGLLVDVDFESTDTVKVSGSGTRSDPWKFTMLGADAKLPEVNKAEYTGNGFTIDKFGRVVNIDDGLQFATNLTFDSNLFSVNYTGTQTMVNVNEDGIKNLVDVSVGSGLSGNGSDANPLALSLGKEQVSTVLHVISNDTELKGVFNHLVEPEVDLSTAKLTALVNTINGNQTLRDGLIQNSQLNNTTIFAMLQTIMDNPDLRAKFRAVMNEET